MEEQGKNVQSHNQIDQRHKLIVIMFIVTIGCVASIITILASNVPKGYNLLVFLPLSFWFCSIVFIDTIKISTGSISIAIALSSLYIRNVILPVIMVLGGCETLARLYVINLYIDQAVWLLIYEQFAIFAVIHFMCRRPNSMMTMNYPSELKIEEFRIDRIILFRIVLFIMSFLVLLCFIEYPQLKYFITFLFNSNMDIVDIQNINFLYMEMSVPGYIYWPVTYIMEILRIILPVYLLFLIRAGKKAKSNELFAVLSQLLLHLFL
jgi:hypothetical protein